MASSNILIQGLNHLQVLVPVSPQILHTTTHPSFALWHFRLGHIFDEKLIVMQQSFPFLKCSLNKGPCEPCHLAKQKQLPFSISDAGSLNAFDLVHFDTWGLLPIPSTIGHKYFLIVIDDKTCFTWVYFIQNKVRGLKPCSILFQLCSKSTFYLN